MIIYSVNPAQPSDRPRGGCKIEIRHLIQPKNAPAIIELFDGSVSGIGRTKIEKQYLGKRPFSYFNKCFYDQRQDWL